MKKNDIFKNIVCFIFMFGINGGFLKYNPIKTPVFARTKSTPEENRNGIKIKSNIVEKGKEKLGKNAQGGAILIDASGRYKDPLFTRNGDIITPMASTTKMMTAMIAIEECKKLKIDIDRKEIVHEQAIDDLGGSSLMGLNKGDMVSMRGLLYGMMLMSGNDAANEIAIRIAGNIPNFINIMNDKAKKLGLKHTTFSSPSGLGEEDVVYIEGLKNQTTAKELAKIAQHAHKNPLFKKIVSTVLIKPEDSKEMWDSTLKGNEKGVWIVNINKLLKKGNAFYYEYANGIKTGYTSKAGRCVVGSAKKGDVELISVVLKDPQDWEDTIELLEYGFSLYKTFNLSDYIAKKAMKDLELSWSGDRDIKFKVKAKKPFLIDIKKDMIDKISYKIKVDPIYITKLKEGEEVGEMEFYLNGKFLGKVPLISDFNI